MLIEFFKYQGTGNDFILINGFTPGFNRSNPMLIQKMCDRKFGIGADGLMVIEKSDKADFILWFFNPDGSQSFCGNGSRCAVRFVLDQQLADKSELTFEAFDGLHNARVEGEQISISMRNVNEIKRDKNGVFINTGSPHLVLEKNSVANIDVVEVGKKMRYDSMYAPIGTNVNFFEVVPGGIKIRTYEKGVENETLSCGTGVTACALAFAASYETVPVVMVETLGGNLEVSFEQHFSVFENVRLKGQAEFVFKGEYNE
jgi:diaminopimelate epimerase